MRTSQVTDIVERAEIYALIDPRTSRIRYIGESVDARQRFRLHRSSPQAGKHEAWISELAELGMEPQLRLLRRVRGRDCYRIEQQIIQSLLRKGYDLTNTLVTGRARARRKRVHSSAYNAKILWIEKQRVFESIAHTARFFDISSGTVSNMLRGLSEMDGVTLRRLDG